MGHKNHNYTNYSKPQTAPVEPQVEEVVEPEVVEAVEAVTEPEEVIEEVVEPEVSEEPEGILGVVTDCVKLNVREEPSAGAEVVTTLLLGTEVMVDIFESTNEFYKITTGAGVEGYCMKDYININA